MNSLAFSANVLILPSTSPTVRSTCFLPSLRFITNVHQQRNKSFSISTLQPNKSTPLKCSAITGTDNRPPSDGGTSIGYAIYKFTRPHTIRGTIIGAFCGCARALIESSYAVDWSLLPRAGLGLIALLLGNAFIVGINQIYDVRVDRINKPFLPLAAGEMSNRAAWGVVITSAIAGLAIVRLCFTRLIFGLYSLGMLFGTLYSVPPFRFKRYPPLAAITISCVRGFFLNFGVYHATKSALQVPFAWSPPITFLAIFMTIFACVIALAKDLPDIRGDKAEGVSTFASRVGPRKLVRIVIAMLLVNYIGAILTAIFAPATALNRPLMAIGHLALGGWLVSYQRSIQPNNQDSIKDFYRFIWKLFYAEYLLFPFI